MWGLDGEKDGVSQMPDLNFVVLYDAQRLTGC